MPMEMAMTRVQPTSMPLANDMATDIWYTLAARGIPIAMTKLRIAAERMPMPMAMAVDMSQAMRHSVCTSSRWWLCLLNAMPCRCACSWLPLWPRTCQVWNSQAAMGMTANQPMCMPWPLTWPLPATRVPCHTLKAPEGASLGRQVDMDTQDWTRKSLETSPAKPRLGTKPSLQVSILFRVASL